jgi:hypothetical protein
MQVSQSKSEIELFRNFRNNLMTEEEKTAYVSRCKRSLLQDFFRNKRKRVECEFHGFWVDADIPTIPDTTTYQRALKQLIFDTVTLLRVTTLSDEELRQCSVTDQYAWHAYHRWLQNYLIKNTKSEYQSFNQLLVTAIECFVFGDIRVELK